MELKVKKTTYKIKFIFNDFCDTDLMDRVSSMLALFKENGTNDDKDVYGLGKLKDLFCCVRELLFVGFKKYNPVETLQDVGNILDDYQDEATEDDKRGLLDLFVKLTEELMKKGFLVGMMDEGTEKTQENGNIVALPQK